MLKNSSKRSPAMDAIRCFALFCVVWVHYYNRINFYAVDINTFPTMLMFLLRFPGMMAVSLFLTLSGYLMQRKTISLGYYPKIIRILSIYFLASACCCIYQNYTLGYGFNRRTILDFISALFNFQSASYGWYVNMYCGLFLLIPYLNLLYHGLEGQRKKLGLLATMLVITALPQVTSILTYSSGYGWFLGNHSFQNILPNWWTSLYPFTYYFLGAYLRDYPLPLKRCANFLFFIISLLIPGIYTIYIGQGGPMIWGSWLEDGSLFTFLQVALLFNLFAQADYKLVGPKFAKVLALLSELSLGAYLVSWIFDDLFYPTYIERLTTVNSRLAYAPVIVLTVFFCSVLLSSLIQIVYVGLGKIFRSMWSCIPKKA